jgi:hypothetical protein
MKTMNPPDRRKFLLAAGLGTAGVAAAVAIASKSQPAKAGAAVPQEDNTRTAYRTSEHIQKYYKTTEV